MDRHILKRGVFTNILAFGFCFLIVFPSWSAIYYVRKDGGSSSECTGLADAAYSGSGLGQNCAFSHPFWAISPIGHSTVMVGGDTLIIDGSDNAEYMIGDGASNTSKCYPAAAYECYMRSIPSGPDPAHPTRILGKGWDTGCANPPQLWGTERVTRILNLNGSDNVEVQCLEVTDHSDCQEHGPNPCNRDYPPFGEWGVIGLTGKDSESVLIKNVNIHGMAFKGVWAARIKDWTIEDSKIVANSFVGWDGDLGSTTSSNSGTILFNRTDIQFNGCGETYPGKQPYNCYSQDQGGYGDGLGTEKTNGDWIFNECDISHNVSDGLDLLYHSGNGSITIKRSLFEGNAGNQVKIASDALIENSLLIGNCAYFADNPITWKTSTFNNCRAAGSALAMRLRTGYQIEIYNSTITSNGDTMTTSGGSTCDGSERIISRNNIYLGGTEFNDGYDKSALYWPGGITGNGDGSCGDIDMEDDYSVIWNTKNFATDCNGKEHSICEDPELLDGAIKYFTGNEFNASLKSTSPAVRKGLTLVGKSSLDYKKKNRGEVWDIGAIEYDTVGEDPTCAADIQYCETETDCTENEYFWYDGICNVDPESEPTCIDGIQYCLTEVECLGRAFFWYDNACHAQREPSSTCADDILYCLTSGDCAENGYYWYNNTCNLVQEPVVPDPEPESEACVPTWCDLPLIECGQTPLTGGTDSCGNPCAKPSAEWPNCIEPEPVPEPEPTCADGIQYCLTSTDCIIAGRYWYDDTCHLAPEPEPTCAENILYCKNKPDCENNRYFWYDNTCNAGPEPVIEPQVEPEPELTCADSISLCKNKPDCEKNGHYWYNNACHVTPEPQEEETSTKQSSGTTVEPTVLNTAIVEPASVEETAATGSSHTKEKSNKSSSSSGGGGSSGSSRSNSGKTKTKSNDSTSVTSTASTRTTTSTRTATTSRTTTGSEGLIDTTLSVSDGGEVLQVLTKEDEVKIEELIEGEMTDLEVETYADLRKKLLDAQTEPEDVEGLLATEEVIEEEEKDILEAFQDGVKKLWQDIRNWFAGLGEK